MKDILRIHETGANLKVNSEVDPYTERLLPYLHTYITDDIIIPHIKLNVGTGTQVVGNTTPPPMFLSLSLTQHVY